MRKEKPWCLPRGLHARSFQLPFNFSSSIRKNCLWRQVAKNQILILFVFFEVKNEVFLLINNFIFLANFRFF